MARLASQGKLGFYPTPNNIVQQIKDCLSIGTDCRLLDPCCGEGEALAMLANGRDDIETLGIELEKGRFEKAKTRLNRVIRADALVEAQISSSFCDVLFLNPPYDDGEEERLEYDFLMKFNKTLSNNGVLIFIIPYRCLTKQNMKEALSRFADVEVYRFPDHEFEAFKQIVIIGRKKHISSARVVDTFELLNLFSSRDPLSLPTTDEMLNEFNERRIMIQTNSKHQYKFEALHIDPDELLPMTATLKDQFFKKASPQNLTDVHPLMPLRKGHLAMLLAAGYVNGELKQEDEHLIIKGIVKRVEERRDESTQSHAVTITKQKSRIIVRALNMNTGNIEEIA